jgi:hypothetical protein
VCCAAISTENEHDQVLKGSSGPTSAIGTYEASGEGFPAAKEAPAASFVSQRDVEEVGAILKHYINSAREDLQRPGAPFTYVHGVVMVTLHAEIQACTVHVPLQAGFQTHVLIFDARIRRNGNGK